jgi:hypothetical protein
MRNRSEQILRIVCLVLAVLLAAQLVKVVLRMNPLHGVVIPALPTLASDTNAPAGKGTNALASKSPVGKGTNKISESGTNALAMKMVNSTNGVGSNIQHRVANAGVTNASARLAESNLISSAGTNENSADIASGISNAVADVFAPLAEKENVISTNSSAQKANVIAMNNAINLPSASVANIASANAGTNSAVLASAKHKTNHGRVAAGTNGLPLMFVDGTNSPVISKSKKTGTNSHVPPEMAMVGMNFGPPGMRAGGPPPELPPEIKARVIRIYESELFGQIMHPMPMALMGIAGDTAFLRAPSGQTGLVKEGDSLGEIKLLRIGINRVLVEENGEKKELTIFNGYGGESLLPKESETKNETPHTSRN